MSCGQNGKEHNKCRPTFKHMPKVKVSNPNSHLKFPIQFKLRLYLKYNLIFKYEIKLDVLSQLNAMGSRQHDI